jgi:hypothetical protein
VIRGFGNEDARAIIELFDGECQQIIRALSLAA